MTISSLGAGSGLDLNTLLTGLMQAEQQPLFALQKREASFQSRISAFGSLKGALSTLQTSASAMVPVSGTTAIAKYTTFSASVADTSIASASASTGAVAGTYSLEVSTLAQTQRLVTPNTAGYTSASNAIATGDLKIEFGSLNTDTNVYTADPTRAKTITISSTNATLGGLRDAINNANIGATATIINGTGGTQLVLSSKETGLANVIKLSGLTGFDYNPATNTGTFTQATAQGGQAASNAAFSLNGISATSSTNIVSGALDGVSLTLTKTTAALTPTTVKVSKDHTGSLTNALNTFIKSYNDANKLMSELGAYNPTTKSAGALQGNSALRTTRNQLSTLVFSASASDDPTFKNLSNIGVTLAKDGSLSLDSTKLSAAIAASPTGVANLVSAVGSAFKTGIEGIIGTGGILTSATEGSERSIKDLTKRQAELSQRLSGIESLYKKRFTALDSLVAGMKQTSSYLNQQLANLPNVSSNK